MTGCELRPQPCCLDHHSVCWAGCGDTARVLRRRGVLVGAFCRACYRELAHGIIPKPTARTTNRMGSRARLRHLQDQAS